MTKFISFQKNIHYFLMVAAMVMMLTTFTVEAAHSSHLPVEILQARPPLNIQILNIPADSVCISGTVKNEHGVPIENVEIIFGQYKTLSDKNGSFRFTFDEELNKPGIIQFSYGKLIREVRSYHPLMGSTSFDIILFELHGPMPMGCIDPAPHLPDSLSKLSFRSSNKLSPETKDHLLKMLFYMSENPGLKILLRPYYKTSRKNAEKLSNLINQFIESEAIISPERIQLARPQARKGLTSEVIIECTDHNE